ncbi:Aste57867_18532 [Aphanomyces stellatus]|uniref:Aste57867_18532 protein n=1 Tax=Aphanomyces stellatus TaxID=120398 RepID=A0A485LE39_9STRA|nr:hypothetical protein As57867_018470 [Aphanomyces stellatus]VFT95268.1 Aste57867_18532 [Aphanomyces stellatus]
MDDSSSDDSELYLALRDLEPTRTRSLRSHAAAASSNRHTAVLEDDETQDMLVALYYWRQKLCSKYFQAWRQGTAPGSTSTSRRSTAARRSSSTRDDLHRRRRESPPRRLRRQANAILLRHQNATQKATARNDDSGYPSSDDESTWSFRLDTPATAPRRHALRAPTSSSSVLQTHTAQVARQRQAIAATIQKEHDQHARMVAIKARFGLLDATFSTWKDSVDADRPRRAALLAAAMANRRRHVHAMVWSPWRAFVAWKRQSTRARFVAARTRYQHVLRAWMYMTSVHRTGAFLASKCAAKRQIRHWREWALAFARRQRWRVLLFYATARRTQTTQAHVYRAWLSFASTNRRKRRNDRAARTFCRAGTLRRWLHTWRAACDIHLAEDRARERVVAQATAVRTWRRLVLRRRQRDDHEQLAHAWRDSQLAKTCMRYWRRYLLVQTHAHHQTRRAEHHDARRRLDRVFERWIRETQRKSAAQARRRLADCWHLVQVRRRTFFAWQSYVDERQRLCMAALHHYSVHTDRVFHGWQRHVQDMQGRRWKAVEMTLAARCRRVAAHVTAWRATAHRLHYLNLLRCRLQIRFALAAMRRHMDAWKAYVLPKLRRRRHCAAFRSHAMARCLGRVLQRWHHVMVASHEWCRFVQLLDESHTTKRILYGFHQWRLHAKGVVVAAARRRRLVDGILVAWKQFASARATRSHKLRHAAQFHAFKLQEQAFMGWWLRLARVRDVRARAIDVQATTRRRVVDTSWRRWRTRHTEARVAMKAMTWHAQRRLRVVFDAFRAAVAAAAHDNKLCRAARLLWTGKLHAAFFDRWVAYVAHQRLQADQTDIARDLHACHCVTRAFRGWCAEHRHRKSNAKWEGVHMQRQLAGAVRQWRGHTTAHAARLGQDSSATTHYRNGMCRRVLLGWSDGAAFRRHLRESAARVASAMTCFRMRQVIQRLHQLASARRGRAAADASIDAHWARVHRKKSVRALAEHAATAKRRRNQRISAQRWGNTQLQRCVLGEWRTWVRRCRHVRAMLVDAMGLQLAAKTKFVFGRWKQFVDRRHRLHVGAAMATHHALVRSVALWHENARESHRFRRLLDHTRGLLFGNTTRTSMAAWKQFAAASRRKREHGVAAATCFATRSRAKALHAWETVYRRQKALAGAVAARTRRQKQRVWSGWRQVIRRRRMRRAQCELAALHFTAKCLRRAWKAWNVTKRESRAADDALVAACRRRQTMRRAWREWRVFQHHAAILRKVTRMWKQRHLLVCFRSWAIFRGHQARKVLQGRQSQKHYHRHLLVRAFEPWRRLQCVRTFKEARVAKAVTHNTTRLVRPCMTRWVILTHRTKRTKQILTSAFRRDAAMSMFRCFRGWQQHVRGVRARCESLCAYEAAVADFKLEKCVAKWHTHATRSQARRLLDQRAMDFLDRKRRWRAFDAWVLFGFVAKERALQTQLAFDHAAAASLRHRFDRWMEFTYVAYQAAQATRHYHATLLQETWSSWMAFRQSLVCCQEAIDVAAQHHEFAMRRAAWRDWRLFCMRRLQSRLAHQHFAIHTQRTTFRDWQDHVVHLHKLRHAWIFWETTALGLRFQRWRRFVETGNLRRAQTRLVLALRQRLALKRWLHWTRSVHQHKSQLVWAANLFYESSVGWYFRQWRSQFASKVHERRQVERAVSHLMCKGVRGYFERWKALRVAAQQQRDAAAMAEYHLVVSRQRRAIRWLRDNVLDHRHVTTIWHHVTDFFQRHANAKCFAAWRAFVVARERRHLLVLTATVHWGTHTQRAVFAHWRAQATHVAYLRARVFRSRHLYFSSLYSRVFFRLRRFATLKRQLRHVSHRVAARRRGEWFERSVARLWKQFRADSIVSRKRAARASRLYRRAHLTRLFGHWKSVACERWMRHRLVEYGLLARETLGLLAAVRRWASKTADTKRIKAQGWRLLEVHLVAGSMARWRRFAASRRAARAVDTLVAHRQQAKALQAWLHSLLQKDMTWHAPESRSGAAVSPL